ncbi:MAG: hypothetical protein IJ787_02570 [Bacilli bacterium]|nr:hypothetical protein [Bacilli bacterium]
MDYKTNLLFSKRLLYVPHFHVNDDIKRCAQANGFLYANCGVLFSNPEYVDDEVLQAVKDILGFSVPPSFYENPQDTKLFSCSELLIEQAISYFFAYGTSIGRIEIFDKELPAYPVGEERVVRKLTIIGPDQVDGYLKEAAMDYCAYKRPFSIGEEAMFLHLIEDGYFTPDMKISCRDNIFVALQTYPELAKCLTQKDIVKRSIALFGADTEFRPDPARKEEFKSAMELAAKCPLSKRQAKYYNKIRKFVYGVKGKETNVDSPYRALEHFAKRGDALEAARRISDKGSLLERNLKFLLSRSTNHQEALSILRMLPDKNPTVLIQLYASFLGDKPDAARLFSFIADRRVVTHVETSAEIRSRRTNLSPTMCKLARKEIKEKIASYYRGQPSLGKIYLSPQMYRVAVPINTSAGGTGIDVYPAGTRIPFDGKYIRIFCYWKDVLDIDASLGLVRDLSIDESYQLAPSEILDWRVMHRKPFGGDALCSGDCTGYEGAEYQDLNIEGLCQRGFRYAIACINGYGGKLNEGEIYQGVQVKDCIDTAAWDPKNITFKMNVCGNSRAFTGFAIDLERKEIIVINQINTGAQVLGRTQILTAKKYLDKRCIDINMGFILSYMGKVVGTKEEADVVFDEEYQSDTQLVVRPYDIAALIRYVNRDEK